MAYDESLVLRVHSLLGSQPGVVSKKMFGGDGFLLNGNMACGVIDEYLIVRVGAERYQEALAEPHTRLFDLRGGRPMKGWVLVQPPGYQVENDLHRWVEQGLAIAAGLPPK